MTEQHHKSRQNATLALATLIHPGSTSCMALAEDFASAQARVKTLKSTPAPDELLELYALYKQATAGDVKGERPGMLDFKGRAKFDAWAARKSTSADAAMTAYVATVERLVKKYG
jgi:acyl-CoA-binding protein